MTAGPAIPDSDYPYDASKTATVLIDSSTEFSIKAGYPECPILGCSIKEDSACTVDLTSPYDSVISIASTSPFAILVS